LPPTEERLHLPGKSVGEMLEFFAVLTCVSDREKHPRMVENFCLLWKMADEYDVVVSTRNNLKFRKRVLGISIFFQKNVKST